MSGTESKERGCTLDNCDGSCTAPDDGARSTTRCTLPHPPGAWCDACGWDGICSSCDGHGCATCSEEYDKPLPPWHDLAGGDGVPPVEPAACLACKRPVDAVNHVPGHVFVGWGIGWQPCPSCGGSGEVRS